MDSKEQRQILALLEEGQAALVLALDGVSPETAVRIPAPGSWTILGCVEHLAVTEDYLFSQIVAAKVSVTPLINPEREARMLARGADRSRKIESPPEGHPKAIFPTLPAAFAHFLASRKRTMDFVAANHDDLRTRMTWHPILADANVHEMLISIGVHCLRHINQIEEIKAAVAAPGWL